jgi:hypothetical protein
MTTALLHFISFTAVPRVGLQHLPQANHPRLQEHISNPDFQLYIDIFLKI